MLFRWAANADPPFLLEKFKSETTLSMRQTPIEKRISDMIDPVIKDTGFDLVSVRVQNDNGAQTLQVMAEDPATRLLGVDDCAKISRAIAATLDVEDPISSAYRLEVSSPGIDRSLYREQDFETYKGFEAKLELNVPNEDGQKRFRGVINGFQKEALKDGSTNTIVHVITQDQGDVHLPFQEITKAKLILTDELIKARSPQRKTENENTTTTA
jgi:ribosome maturation factor RimP